MDNNLDQDLKEALQDIKITSDIQQRVIQNCKTKKKARPSKSGIYRAIAAVLVIAILATSLFIWQPWMEFSVYANDLMKGVTSNVVETTELEEGWIQAVADFSVELFQNGLTKNVNSLLSPLSVYLTLAMSANGAKGETLEAFQEVLGNGISMEEINEYAYSLLARLCKEGIDTLEINNSIWFDRKACGTVYREFIQKNADYYGADAFQLNFTKESESLEQINQWVADKIRSGDEEMLESIEPGTAMLLINTILFDSKWKVRYDKKKTAPFQNADDTWVMVRMLKGEKQYIENENATGFISPYKDERFSFVALLPKEGMSLEEYVSNLTGQEFLDIVDLESQEVCLSYLPEFSYNYKMELSGALKNMGLEVAFGDSSDFSNLSTKGSMIYIEKVEHQTFIQLDEEGTKAGAVTVENLSTRGPDSGGGRYVFLNRPFLYAIIDNETELPIFLGTVNQLEGEATEAQEYSSYLEEKDGVTYRVVTNSENFTAIVKGPEDVKTVTIDCYHSPEYWITYIEPYAYANSQMLEEVNFQYVSNEEGLTVGKNAFANCPNLTKVYFTPEIGMFDVRIEEDAFAGSEQVVFYVPKWFTLKDYEAELYLYALEHDIPVVIYDAATE